MRSAALDFKKNLESPLVTPLFLDKTYFPSLDGWRAIAILFVLLGHLKLMLLESSIYFRIANIFVFAHLGVKIFFVLSGFLITSILIKELIKTNGINFKMFFIKRVLRIFPALYLYLIVLGICNYIFNLNSNFSGFLASALYISNFSVFGGSWYTGHTWSLSIEEQFYLMWPFILPYVKENLSFFIILIIIVHTILKVFWWRYPNYSELTLAPFLTDAEAIFVGAIFSFLSFKNSICSNSKIWQSKIMTVSFIFIVILIYYLLNKGLFAFFLLPFGSLIQNSIIGFLILQTLINSKSLLYNLLNTKFMIKFGLISYSIYIWQQLFIVPQIVNYRIPYLTIFPINIAITLISAYISYHYFESYFLKIKQSFI